MTELDLYRFINENEIEWHKASNHGKEDIIIFINNQDIELFHSILSPSIFDDEGIECWMKDGYFCFFMDWICGYYGVEMNNIFKD